MSNVGSIKKLPRQLPPHLSAADIDVKKSLLLQAGVMPEESELLCAAIADGLMEETGAVSILDAIEVSNATAKLLEMRRLERIIPSIIVGARKKVRIKGGLSPNEIEFEASKYYMPIVVPLYRVKDTFATQWNAHSKALRKMKKRNQEGKQQREQLPQIADRHEKGSGETLAKNNGHRETD